MSNKRLIHQKRFLGTAWLPNRVDIFFIVPLLLIGLNVSCQLQRERNIGESDQEKINRKSGRKTYGTKFLISSTGDTIQAGVPILAKGKWINPDSVTKPQTIPLKEKPKLIPAQRNVFPVGKPKIVVIPDKLRVMIPGKDGVALPVTTPAHGKVVQATQPKPVPAAAPRIKDVANYDIQYLDIDQGMNSYNIFAMVEDRQGNLWFATEGGVSRYDGISFSHFTTREGLIYNRVLSMLEDRSGNLWFGTQGGLSRYDGNSFTNYTTEEGLTSNKIWSMLEDKEGFIWFGTLDGGTSRYDPAHGGSFTHYTTKEGLSNNNVWSILEDSQGDIWFGTEGGVSRYNSDQGNPVNRPGGAVEQVSFTHYTTKEGLSHNVIWSIQEDLQGHLWFGTQSGGLSRFDGQQFMNYSTEEGLSSNGIYSMLKDNQGNLWLGTNGGGVSRYKPDSLRSSFTHFTTDAGLTNNYVWSILEDSQGNLWFGTSGGVNRYNSKSFRHYTTREGLSNNWVRAVMEDSQGNLWVGTKGGLNRYKDGSFTQYTTAQGLNTNFILALHEDSQRNIWIGTNRGVSRYEYNRDQESFTHYTSAEGLSDNWVRSILEDNQDYLWFSTLGGGVSRYDGESFTHFTINEGLSDNSVWPIIMDSQSHLWFGTFGGASVYNGKSFTHYTTKTGFSDNGGTFSILEDDQSYLWFGTDGDGVSQFDGKFFAPYTTAEGLSDDRIRSMLEDDNKNIWISTHNGINLLVPPSGKSTLPNNSQTENYQIFTFGKMDGLKKVAFEVNSVCLDSQNRLWWGSSEGLTMLDLNQFELSREAPSLRLNTIEVKEEFVDYRRLSNIAYQNDLAFGKALSQSFDSVASFFNYPVTMRLPYNLNYLSFHFSAIDWVAQHKINYSFYMDGFDEAWSIPKPEHKAIYRNLPHGSFTFKVKAMGEAQIWSQPIEYSFYIYPPWWHSWWARTLYVIVGGSFIISYVRWRTAELKKRQKELEKTVTERTAEVVAQKERSDELLLNILPSETAEELKKFGAAKAKNYKMVTVLFTDFKEFTLHSERLSPEALVAEIDHCFKAFDLIMEKHNVEKIKTVGDAYLAAAGLPVPNSSNPVDALKAALAIRDFMLEYKAERATEGREAFEIRIGLHTGPVVAGIVGIKKFAYDIWGDTVNLAARMESSSEVGKVNVSQSTYDYLKDHPAFNFISRGKVKAKHKGEIEMYFAESTQYFVN